MSKFALKPNFCFKFAKEQQGIRLMNNIALNNLWSYLQGLSLSANNKRWLAERLIDSTSTHQKTDKEKRLETLSGVWNNEEGENIAAAIRNARRSDYIREIETL